MMTEKSEATIADLKSQIQELRSGPPVGILGLPIKQCPPTTSGNQENWFKLENVEFYQSQEDFPRCYYRLNTAASGNRISAETVLMQQSEALSI